MTSPRGSQVTITDVLKALGDPIRWDIVQQLAEVVELPCSALEDTLPISKPTISYHTKILTQAGLIGVRKQGRNSFYTLRRDVLTGVVEGIGALDLQPSPVGDRHSDLPAGRGGRRPSTPTQTSMITPQEPTQPDTFLLTW